MSHKEIPAHVMRMLEELKDLQGNRGKLEAFILSNPVFKALPQPKQRLMRQQYDAMSRYGEILQERIDMENQT